MRAAADICCHRSWRTRTLRRETVKQQMTSGWRPAGEKMPGENADGRLRPRVAASQELAKEQSSEARGG